MRILVCSDSHGRSEKLRRIAEIQPEAHTIVHLGDGEAEGEELLRLPGRKVYRVCGNCDFGSRLPGWALFTTEGLRVLCTHGHLPKVDWSLDALRAEARESSAQIALFGHTHTPYNNYEDGLHLFNPGAVKDGRYGFVDITAAGVFCQHCELK